MMTTNGARPKWWQVYLTFPLLVGLFMVDTRLKLSSRGHQAVQIGSILLIYGLIRLWLKANATALMSMDQQRFHATVTVIRAPVYQLSDTKNEKRRIFQFPNSEIKGILSDTFEMDYIDAEYISVDEVSQELNKE
ncbi:MAG: hypothetical protein K8S20_09270 [Chloroflexi bacterium]|nr:hypothetical protein [Chloroflexota bacterium]